MLRDGGFLFSATAGRLWAIAFHCKALLNLIMSGFEAMRGNGTREGVAEPGSMGKRRDHVCGERGQVALRDRPSKTYQRIDLRNRCHPRTYGRRIVFRSTECRLGASVETGEETMTIIRADCQEPSDLSPSAAANDSLRPHLGSAMLKTVACFSLAVAIAASPTAAHAVSGASSSWGSYGAGPTIPTQALSPFDRAWNQSHESQNEAIAGSQWLREHHAGGTTTSLGPMVTDRSPRTNPRHLWHRWYR